MKKHLNLFAVCFILLLFTNGYAQTFQELSNIALESYQHTNYKQSIEYANLALNLAKSDSSINKSHYQQLKNFLALLYQKTNQQKLAEKLLVEIIQENDSISSPISYKNALIALIQHYELTQEFSKTLPLQNKLIKIDSSRTELLKLAEFHDKLRQFNDAIKTYKKVLQQSNEIYLKQPNLYFTDHQQVIKLLEKSNQLNSAIQLSNQLLKKSKAQSNFNEIIKTLSSLGYLYQKSAQYDQSLDCFKSAQLYILQNTPKDTSALISILNHLAGTYKITGDYSRASSISSTAFELASKFYGTHSVEYALQLSNLGGLDKDLGKIETALSKYLDAYNIIKEDSSHNISYLAVIRNNIGDVYHHLGQFQKAFEYKNQALHDTALSEGKKTLNYANALNNLASLYQDSGYLKKARDLFFETKELLDSLQYTSNILYTNILNNLALTFKADNQLDSAQKYILQSLVLIEKTFGKKYYLYGIYLANLSTINELRGAYDLAISQCLESNEIIGQSLGIQHPQYGISLLNSGNLYQKKRQPIMALEMYRKSFINDLQNIHQNLYGLTEAEKEIFLNLISGNFQVYQSFFYQHIKDSTKISEDFYTLELATKELILNSTIQLKIKVLFQNDTSVSHIYEKWLINRKILSTEYSKPKDERRIDLENIEKLTEFMESEWTRRLKYKNANVSQKSWKDIQQGLGEHEVAIEFSSFQFYNKGRWTDTTFYLATIVKKYAQFPISVKLCTQKQLDSLLNFQSKTKAPFINRLYSNLPYPKGLGNRLYELLWQPLEKHLNDVQTITYALSGDLHTIAFSALPVNTSQVLSDKYQLKQVATTLSILKTSSTIGKINKVILFGGINYDMGESPSIQIPNTLSSRNIETWPYLYGTEKEVQAISKTAKSQNIIFEEYTGSQASEEQFYKSANEGKATILHLATHGFYLPHEKKPIYTRLSAYRKNLSYSTQDLLHSGLLMAGANSSWNNISFDRSEDGILTAYEISGINLEGTYLVVLSACESGLGVIKGSEGVYGLQRAFRAAGVKYILMSLWQIPDKETVEFMDLFYKYFLNGFEIESAFLKAQEILKNKYRKSPYHWAGFVLIH